MAPEANLFPCLRLELCSGNKGRANSTPMGLATPHLTISSSTGHFVPFVPHCLRESWNSPRVFPISLRAANTHRPVRGVWFAWLDHIGIRYRRKRHIARIFDRRRRRIGNRNIGLWRQRRYLYWRNARLGRGRSGNLVRLVGFKLFQNQYPSYTCRLRCRLRMMMKQTLACPPGSGNNPSRNRQQPARLQKILQSL